MIVGPAFRLSFVLPNAVRPLADALIELIVRLGHSHALRAQRPARFLVPSYAGNAQPRFAGVGNRVKCRCVLVFVLELRLKVGG
jgi:hypothetical protein